MIGVNQIGLIQKFLSGGWTSEDIDNPVYSKKKPLSIKEQQELIIKDRLRQGINHLDKAARIGFGLARLHPTYGIALNIVDASNELKEAAKGNGSAEGLLNYTSNLAGAMSKTTYNMGNNDKRTHFKNVVQKNRARLGIPGLMAMGVLMGLPDYMLDIKSLYDTVIE